MPKKIHVVSLSPHDKVESEEEVIQPNNDEVELNQIREEIKKEEEITPPVEPKAKAKRKPAQKKIKVVEQPNQNGLVLDLKASLSNEQPMAEVIEQPMEEPLVEEVKTTTKTKEAEYVECPKCNKKMLKKSYRYNHEQTCQGKPRDEIPVKKRTPSQPEPVVKQNKNNYENVPIASTPIIIPEEIIQKEIQKRITQQKENRIKQKQELYKNLGKQIV